jgi:hypothetical protein
LTYKVQKLLCPLVIKVERIHACSNDCILYRNEYNDLKKYPKCKVSWYKQKTNQIMENEDDDIDDRKRPVVKVLWYLPIVPRFWRLFLNSNDAKLLRWHKEGRKKDRMLRYPANSS